MPLNVDSLNAGTISQNGEPVKPYKIYTALLTQSGTDAPVATVLENTIGDIWFTYLDTGVFYINSNGLFTQGKTTFSSPIYLLTNYSENPNFPIYLYLDYLDNNNIELRSIQSNGSDVWSNTNSIIGNNIGRYTPIEIRVYS